MEADITIILVNSQSKRNSKEVKTVCLYTDFAIYIN